LAGALPQTPLGELTALPQTPSWILGGLLLRGGEIGPSQIFDKFTPMLNPVWHRMQYSCIAVGKL